MPKHSLVEMEEHGENKRRKEDLGYFYGIGRDAANNIALDVSKDEAHKIREALNRRLMVPGYRYLIDEEIIQISASAQEGLIRVKKLKTDTLPQDQSLFDFMNMILKGYKTHTQTVPASERPLKSNETIEFSYTSSDDESFVTIKGPSEKLHSVENKIRRNLKKYYPTEYASNKFEIHLSKQDGHVTISDLGRTFSENETLLDFLKKNVFIQSNRCNEKFKFVPEASTASDTEEEYSSEEEHLTQFDAHTVAQALPNFQLTGFSFFPAQSNNNVGPTNSPPALDYETKRAKDELEDVYKKLFPYLYKPMTR